MKWVLIADNDLADRQLVAASLAHVGAQIIVAANGNEAWSLLQSHRPDLALLDIGMPGMDGLELTKAIRADSALKGMRIILVTARSDDEDVRAGEAVGADAYVTKPYSPHGLQHHLAEQTGATKIREDVEYAVRTLHELAGKVRLTATDFLHKRERPPNQ